MKTLKRIVILSMLSLLIIAAFSKVNAASANISSNKTSMKVGDTASITVSYTAAAWNVQVSGAVSYSSADASSNAKNTSKSASLKFKPKNLEMSQMKMGQQKIYQNQYQYKLKKNHQIIVILHQTTIQHLIHLMQHFRI